MYAYETAKTAKTAVIPAAGVPYERPVQAQSAVIKSSSADSAQSLGLAELKQSIVQRMEKRSVPLNSGEGGVVQMDRTSPENLPPLGKYDDKTRHHIIPQDTMTSFIENLTMDSQTSPQAAGLLADLLSTMISQYEETWSKAGYDERNKQSYQKYNESMGKIERLISPDKKKRVCELIKGCSEEEKSTIASMFQWLPSNLVVGKMTNNRVHDPEDNVDTEAFRFKEEDLKDKYKVDDIIALDNELQKYNEAHNDEALGKRKVSSSEYLKSLAVIKEYLPVMTHFGGAIPNKPDDRWDGVYANLHYNKKVNNSPKNNEQQINSTLSIDMSDVAGMFD